MRNEHNYTKWRPIKGIPEKVDIVAIRDDIEGFRVIVESKDEIPDTYCICFETYASYRQINETNYLVFDKNIPLMEGLYKLKDSEFMRDILKMSGGKFSKEELTHYAIHTDDRCLDVVCLSEPEVYLL